MLDGGFNSDYRNLNYHERDKTMVLATGPRMIVGGFAVWKEKQRYELIGSTISDEGKEILFWKAPCCDCDEEFVIFTMGNEFKHPTRRCEACRQEAGGRRVKRNGYRHSLKRVRRAAGLTQERLGEIAGVNPSYISGCETRRTSLSDKAASKLAAALGVSVSELWGDQT